MAVNCRFLKYRRLPVIGVEVAVTGAGGGGGEGGKCSTGTLAVNMPLSGLGGGGGSKSSVVGTPTKTEKEAVSYR